jgi:hypothetical protein
MIDVNVAWALLSTQPLKTGYDAQMLARPVPALNVLYKYVAQPALYEPYISLVLGRKGDREFINVQGCPRTLVWTIARLPTTFNCDINTSFWTAFASGFYDDWRYWPLAKCAVQNYWQDVINTPQYDPHPRRPMYIMLSQYAVSKNSGSFRRQLQAVPNGNQPTVGVSPELWQVVADCFHIELLVITGDQRADGRVQSYPVVPRGDHNARQVFLRREADGEYHFVRPNKPSPYEWRYTAHMHPDLLNAPKGAKLTAHNTKCNVSTAKRCPYLVTDADGVYTKPPAAIPQYHLLVAFLHVPSHVLDEAADVVNQDQTAGGAVDAYFNNGRWR